MSSPTDTTTTNDAGRSSPHPPEAHQKAAGRTQF